MMVESPHLFAVGVNANPVPATAQPFLWHAICKTEGRWPKPGFVGSRIMASRPEADLGGIDNWKT